MVLPSAPQPLPAPVRGWSLRRLATASLAGALLVVSGCSGEPERPAPSSTSTTAAATTSTPSPFSVSGKGLTPELTQTLTTLYGGGAVPATAGAVTTTLASRTPLTTPITVAGQVRAFKRTPIAVATHDEDVTLLVQGSAGVWTVVGGWWPSLGIASRVPAPTMRILAIGSDARRDETPSELRADALQIIGVDAKGVGGIVGIPRDSYVPLSTGGSNKINAAMVFGGVSAQVSTVQSASGVPIDGYVMTGFKGFEELIDAVGGLAYTSPGALTSHVGKPLLKKGLNKLAGLTTLNFARERKNVEGGDFGRSANQGRLIVAGMSAARAAGPVKLPTYLQALGASLETDLSAAEVLVLASSIFVADPARTPIEVATGSLGTAGGQSVVLLGSKAQGIFADIEDARLG